MKNHKIYSKYVFTLKGTSYLKRQLLESLRFVFIDSKHSIVAFTKQIILVTIIRLFYRESVTVDTTLDDSYHNTSFTALWKIITKGSNWQIGKIIIGNLLIITLSIRNESRFCTILFDIHHRVWGQLAIELDEYVFIAITIIHIKAHAQLMVMVKLWRKVGSVNESIVMLIYWIINSKRFFINTHPRVSASEH